MVSIPKVIPKQIITNRTNNNHNQIHFPRLYSKNFTTIYWTKRTINNYSQISMKIVVRKNKQINLLIRIQKI